MNLSNFVNQITRLQNTFGKIAYSQERADLIWFSCKDFSDAWFTRTVDEFISSMRQAPLPTDFAEAAAKERERAYQIEREQRRNEPMQFSQMLMREAPMLFDVVRQIGSGAMPEENRQGAIQMIQHAAKEAERVNCESCLDAGLIFSENPVTVRKCTCIAGRKRPERF